MTMNLSNGHTLFKFNKTHANKVQVRNLPVGFTLNIFYRKRIYSSIFTR